MPYDSIRRIDLSSSGTIVAELSSPPQCHESLQVSSNNSAITMTVMISQEDVEHFIRILRIRGMVWRGALCANFFLILLRRTGSN